MLTNKNRTTLVGAVVVAFFGTVLLNSFMFETIQNQSSSVLLRDVSMLLGGEYGAVIALVVMLLSLVIMKKPWGDRGFFASMVGDDMLAGKRKELLYVFTQAEITTARCWLQYLESGKDKGLLVPYRKSVIAEGQAEDDLRNFKRVLQREGRKLPQPEAPAPAPA